MTRMVSAAVFGLLAYAAIADTASAAPINSPVPTNTYITYAGLDWAWGGSCPYQGLCGDELGPNAGGGSLAYQSTQGWRLPTALEVGALPLNFAEMFVFPGANVPDGLTELATGATFLNGAPSGAAACAAPYFSTTALYCDWNDGLGGAWAASAADQFYEQLYVRTSVPEPTSLALFGVTLAGLAAARRRRA